MALSRTATLAYVVSKLGIGVTSQIFNLFYVDLYLNVYGLTQWWFAVGQIVYFVWNSVNDPLFGWLQDNSTSDKGRRSPAIYYGAPLLAISFLVPFFRPSAADSDWMTAETRLGLHFTLALCLFDGFWTYVCLAHSALLTDTCYSGDRAQLLQYGEYGTVLSALPVFVSYVLFDKSNLLPFQLYMLSVALFAFGAMWWGSRHTVELGYGGHHHIDGKARVEASSSSSSSMKDNISGNDGTVDSYVTMLELRPSSSSDNLSSSTLRHHKHHQHQRDGSDDGSFGSNHALLSSTPKRGATTTSTTIAALSGFWAWWHVVKQILAHRNFRLFVGVNFVQVCNMAFASNFFTMIEAQLLGGVFTSSFRGSLVLVTEVLSPLLSILLSPHVIRFGSYRVIKIMFVVKLVLACLTYAMGQQHLLFVAFFLLANRVLTSSTFNFFNLSVSDLVDEDFVHRRRAKSMAAMYFGTNALFTKPGYSFAPMFVVRVLAHYGYDHDKSKFRAKADGARARHGMFVLLCLFPAVSCVVQLLLWRRYTLHGTHLESVKNRVYARHLSRYRDKFDNNNNSSNVDAGDELPVDVLAADDLSDHSSDE
eukprot:TRINITY_DN66604_c6_g1_i1.p1 TRINITY_DN66604_c6_g1~~TRINITY_DN66604_c6_g1_i1.p1  ORF type:complete len:591 (-),score=293.82 TRINITY_DN66604_c6_g1_i1:49-1821(-)